MEMLPFTGCSQWPRVEYSLEFDGHEWEVIFKHGWLTVQRDLSDVCTQRLADDWVEWNDELTHLYLTLIGAAIRTGDFQNLRLPTIKEARKHPLYRKGPLPTYCVGLVCGQEQALVPEGTKLDRRSRRQRKAAGLHDHEECCYAWVGAEEVDRWIAAHPREHAVLRARALPPEVEADVAGREPPRPWWKFR